MSAAWMVDQLTLIAEKRQAGLDLQVPRYNPRPAGVIREGSATAAVLALLEATPQRWWEFRHILNAIGRTDKATCWALLYLRSRGLIECVKDDGRNARYLRYRSAKGNRNEKN